MDVGHNRRESFLAPLSTEETERSECSSLSTPFERTGRKKALLIGISTCKTEGYPKLTGPHEDVYKMRDLLLEIYGYTPSEITILLDIEGYVQPTRDNILAAIAELVKDVKQGDQLYFHYSGHSTQRDNPRSNSEEDGRDECLVPLDGEDMMIVDNQLHASLVEPLPSGSHLVAVLDTCHSGSLLDLRHYRCNRVYVPWTWRGRRNSEEIRNGILRRGARLLTLSHIRNHASSSFAPSLRSSTGIREPTRSGSGSTTKSGLIRIGGGPIAKSGPLARMRTGNAEGSLRSLRTLSLSLPWANKKKKNTWILSFEEEARCQSPVGQFPCNGWCRNPEKGSTLPEERKGDDGVKADVIALASCKDAQMAWEMDGVSMTSSLVDLLRENPHQSLKDLLFRISHATYSFALVRHKQSKLYKKQRKTYATALVRRIKQLKRSNTVPPVLPDTPPVVAVRGTLPPANTRGPREVSRMLGDHIVSLKQKLKAIRQSKGYDMDNFQNPELASPRPLDMNRPWRM